MSWKVRARHGPITLLVVTSFVYAGSSETAWAGDNFASGVVEEYVKDCGEENEQASCEPIHEVRVIEHGVGREDYTDKRKGGLYALTIPSGSSKYILAYCKDGYQTRSRSYENQETVQKLKPMRLLKTATIPSLTLEQISALVDQELEQFSEMRGFDLSQNWLALTKSNLQKMREAIVEEVHSDEPKYKAVSLIDEKLGAISYEVGDSQNDVCTQ